MEDKEAAEKRKTERCEEIKEKGARVVQAERVVVEQEGQEHQGGEAPAHGGRVDGDSTLMCH